MFATATAADFAKYKVHGRVQCDAPLSKHLRDCATALLPPSWTEKYVPQGATMKDTAAVVSCNFDNVRRARSHTHTHTHTHLCP
eukprot:6081165-Pleurochrysis_carterae.AAC.2